MPGFADQMAQASPVGAGGLPSPEGGGAAGGMAQDPLNVLRMLARHGKRRKKGGRKKKG